MVPQIPPALPTDDVDHAQEIFGRGRRRWEQVAQLTLSSNGRTREWLVQVGVFDYDTVVFPDLWKSRGDAVFKGYLRYYLSDHRPMWVELRPR